MYVIKHNIYLFFLYQGDIPAIPQKIIANALPIITSINNGDWSINPTERAKYDQLFDSLQPSNGYISGNKVKGVLMDSKLPLDTLGKIWDLADMDKDGMLDRHEFVVVSINHLCMILYVNF